MKLHCFILSLHFFFFILSYFLNSLVLQQQQQQKKAFFRDKLKLFFHYFYLFRSTKYEGPKEKLVSFETFETLSVRILSHLPTVVAQYDIQI